MCHQIQQPWWTVEKDNSQHDWRIILRWQEFTAENRVNLIRAIGLAVFYSIQLINFNFFEIDQADLDASTTFHQNTTLLCAAWFAIVLAIAYCLTVRWFPNWFKYATTTIDLVMLTAIASIGSASASPLVYVYFMILVMAALRFDLWLIRITTGLAALCYVALLAISSPDWLGEADLAVEKTVPRITQMIVLASLILAGVTLGQIARRARAIADEFHKRCQDKVQTKRKESGDE